MPLSVREQEKREERQRMRSEAGGALDLDDEGSFDDGDPYTTNLYIGRHSDTMHLRLVTAWSS